MKLSFLLAIFFLFNSYLFGQTQTVSGILFDENLNMLPEVIIKNMNNEVIGKTDSNGKFQIILPENVNELKFAFLGFETTLIKFSQNCRFLEIVMANYFIYDFVSEKKAERLRQKRLRKFPQVYEKGFDTGLLQTKTPCFKQNFN